MRVSLMYVWIVLFVSISLVSCGTLNRPYLDTSVRDWEQKTKNNDKTLVHSLYLVGDAGELDNHLEGRNFVLEAIMEQLKESEGDESLVYLGDNLYPQGLERKKHEDRERGEKILNAQLKLANYVDGNTVFIPGNHDWKKGKKGGLKYILRQEKYVESYYEDGPKVKMYPGQGCGDPKVVKINKDLVFVYLDTQWWLQNWENEPDINQGCEVKSHSDLLRSIEEIMVEHKNDEIVVLMHHPIYSNGNHGGKFSFEQHLFPLKELNKNLLIPLPVLGSIYPIHRQITGHVQDIPNGKNSQLMQSIDQLAKRLKVNVVFASGHEHSMQFFENDRIKYVVSGSGAKHTYTIGGENALYAREARGFARILFYEDFESWIEFYSVEGFGLQPTLEFRRQIRAPRPGSIEETTEYTDIAVKDTLVAANESFLAKPVKSFFMGEQYRDMWATPVTVPTINLYKTMGGLKPIKKGGGMSSNSLRMEASDEKQYILRSINKDYTKLVPPQFGNLKVLNIMKDQNSASHPYGALAIPALSKAANIYYTDPKLVFLKHQAALGNYNSQFPEGLYLLEQRPSGDWSDAAQFGNSSEIISYTDVLENLKTKKRHFVDQKWVLKSRMFDLLIHDWDRHDDQWRWASFEEDDDQVLYRPIPRDRDQVFYKFKGVVPKIIAATIMKKFKTMDSKFKDVKNLSFNARWFDRYFMNELEWKEWEEVISELQQNMTDDILEQSFAGIPDEVEQFDSDDIIKMLKSRRGDLMEAGKTLYDFLSKEVEISATDNDDQFNITIYQNGTI